MDETAHELMPHGTEDFPCVGYEECHTDQPGGDFPWHWHNDIEVIVCDTGHIRVRVPGSECLLAAGDACFVNTGQLHHIAGEPVGRMRSIVAYPPMLYGSGESVFATRYVRPVVRDESLALVAFRAGAKRDRVAVECIDRAIQALADEPFGYEFEVRARLSRLMCEVLMRERGGMTGAATHVSVDAARIRAMCDYVEAHLAEDVHAADVAGAAGVGERECLRCFRRVLGTTPMAYLRRRRIDVAAGLLVHDAGMSVADAAKAVGVASPAHFSQLFRREYRCTPREYRARMLAAPGPKIDRP